MKMSTCYSDRTHLMLARSLNACESASSYSANFFSAFTNLYPHYYIIIIIYVDRSLLSPVYATISVYNHG